MNHKKALLIFFLLTSLCYCEERLCFDEEFYVLKITKDEHGEKIKKYLTRLSSEMGFDIFYEGVQLSPSAMMNDGVQLSRFGLLCENGLGKREQSVGGMINGKFIDQNASDKTMFVISSHEITLEIEPSSSFDEQKKELQRHLSELSKSEDFRMLLMQR